MKNYFEILDLDEKFDITQDIIRKQYFKMQKSHHPDQDGHMHNSILVNEAYYNLSDPLLRAQHIFELYGIDIVVSVISPRVFDLMNDPNHNFQISLNKMELSLKEDDIESAYESWCECQYLKRMIDSFKS